MRVSNPYLTEPKNQDWILSGYDRQLLMELHQVIRTWLPVFSKGEDVSRVAVVLTALEDLINQGRVNIFCEIEISRISEGQGGIAVGVAISNTAINLSLSEFVSIGEQGFDHGSILDEDSRPISMEMTPMGSFDQEMFANWCTYALECAPEGPGDSYPKGRVHLEITQND